MLYLGFEPWVTGDKGIKEADESHRAVLLKRFIRYTERRLLPGFVFRFH